MNRPASAPFAQLRRGPAAGVTLVEVAIGIGILALMMTGLLSTLVQSRRLTEGTIAQSAAVTVVQGYLEQIKNMEFSSLPYTNSGGTVQAGSGSAAAMIPTRIDESTLDELQISTGAIPPMANVNWNSTPTGVVNNDRSIDVNFTPSVSTDNVPLRIWVWIGDISNATYDATQVRSIIIIYQWQVRDGSRVRNLKGSIRSIRSAVPTF